MQKILGEFFLFLLIMQKQANKENIMIYLDMTGDLIPRKKIAKAVEKFAEEKRKINPDTSFGIVLFEEDGNPHAIDDISDIKELADVINKSWKSRNKQSFLENGLMYCLSVLAEKASARKGTFRILVISDLPSDTNSELEDAILNLVEVVRVFPTFIDIIRIGNQRFYPDDVKLRLITVTASGGLFYGENEKDLESILNGLAKNKKLSDLLPEGGQAIDQSHVLYYEALASALVDNDSPGPVCSICEAPDCNYCGSTTDIPKSCPQCGTNYHQCCAALYSWKMNVGIKHIFRCKTCTALIKLDENFVYATNNEHPPQEQEYDEETVEEIFDDDEFQSKEEYFEPGSVSDADSESDSDDDSEPGSQEQIQDIESINVPAPEIEKNISKSPKTDKPSDSDKAASSTSGAIVKKTASGKKVKFVRTMFGTLRPVVSEDDDDEDYDDDVSIEEESEIEDGAGEQEAKGQDQEKDAEEESEEDSEAARIAERRRQRKSRIKICSFCGSYVKSTDKLCPNCKSIIY